MTNRRGQVVEFTYDALDQLTSRTADGQTTTYATDPLGRWTATSNAESTDTLKFDLAGRAVAEITVRNGTVYTITSTYDQRNLRTNVAMGAPGWSSSIGYGYDAHLQLRTLTDLAGGVTRVEYNADRQPDAHILPMELRIERGHSSTHMPSKIAYPTNGVIDAAIGVHYGYDALKRVQDRLNHDRSTGRSYRYDAGGRLIEAQDFHMVASEECIPLYEGGRLSPSHPDEEPVAYDCPDGNRVTDATLEFGYDLVGNRTDSAALVETGNRLRSFAGVSYEYDADGNLTSRVDSGGGQTFLTWNSLGQLVSATTAAGTTTFGYDGWGRRVRKAGPLDTQHYLHDGDNFFAELDGSWVVRAEYAFYPGVDRPHSVRRGGAMYYYTTDHQGSVVGLIDAAGTLVNEYRYAPFGADVGGARSIENPLQFAARELDRETGLYYNRARYYDPELGRFISEDPIGLTGGIHPYRYASNDPVNRVDPFGTQDEWVCKTTEIRTQDDEGNEQVSYHIKCERSGGGGASEAGFGRQLAQWVGALVYRYNPRVELHPVQ